MEEDEDIVGGGRGRPLAQRLLRLGLMRRENGPLDLITSLGREASVESEGENLEGVGFRQNRHSFGDGTCRQFVPGVLLQRGAEKWGRRYLGGTIACYHVRGHVPIEGNGRWGTGRGQLLEPRPPVG